MLPTISSKAEINGQTSDARRAYRPMSDAVKTKTSPLNKSHVGNNMTTGPSRAEIPHRGDMRKAYRGFNSANIAINTLFR